MRARMLGPSAPLATRSTLGVCAILCLLAVPAFAQKTDVITLTNGNTLTCEIKLLDRGRLQASTDALGTVNVEWDEVASVTSTRTFRVETASGRREFGQLATSQPGQLDVVTVAGPLSMPLEDVVYITPIGSRFWTRLDGSLDLGLSYTQSSGVAQLNFSTSATYRRPTFQLTGSASSYFTKQEEADDTARHTVQFQGVRPFGDQWLWLAQGGFERNQELGYDLRGTVSSGFGRFLVRSNRAVFVLGGGLSTNRELPTEGESVQNLDGLLSLRQSYFTYDYPKTDISTSLDVYPGLSQWGRVRMQFDGKIKREIVHDFSVGFTIYDSYDSDPPTADARKNDVGLSLTIGWTF
jgi:hypothetical protein